VSGPWLLGLAGALALAMPLHAQTFFHVGGADRTGMAVEVQRGVVAGVVVSQPEGRATSTATFSGTVVVEHAGGESPFTTTFVHTANVQAATLPGGVAEPAMFRRVVGVGVDTIEFQRATRTVMLEPFGFQAASALDDWAGVYFLVRLGSEGLVDATELNFSTRAEIDGRPALIGTAPDGRAGLVLLDPVAGILAGAYEARPGEPVAFALLGRNFPTEHRDGVWVATGADGSWVGGDHALRLLRLDTPASSSKAALFSVPGGLHALARRALEAATKRQRPGTGDLP
jgi:hypothetical protein